MRTLHKIRTCLLAAALAPGMSLCQAAEPTNNEISSFPLTGPMIEIGDVQTGDALPMNFQPWWHSSVNRQLAAGSQPMDVSVPILVAGALANSDQVRAFSDLPLIRQQTIGEALGEFDWRMFAQTEYNRISDPVGNFLTTGGPNRFRENDWDFWGGLRRRNYHGGQFEIAQEFGLTSNNSQFFIPDNQGTSRLRLRYTQPLLRGAGVDYNTADIHLARLDAAAANDEFSRQLQSHIVEIARAYWTLHVQRATLLQRVKLVNEGRQIYDVLEKRKDLDVAKSQYLRARSALADRQSQLARSRTAVRNAESRIVALVNDPAFETYDLLELVPHMEPNLQQTPVDMIQSKLTALSHRPEIAQAHKQIAAAGVRRSIARNELKPYLDAVVETYVAGLNGSDDIGQSFVDQFSEGEPGYMVGLSFEYPICNRTARARFRRRQLELRQLQSQLAATIDTLTAEVEVAVREVETSYNDMHTKYLAMQANQAEVEATGKRWEVLAGQDANATLYLDNLLSAQVRLALSENEFSQAVATYNLSLISLSRAQGTLLDDQRIEITKVCGQCLPEISLSQGYEVVGEAPANWISTEGMVEEPATLDQAKAIEQTETLDQAKAIEPSQAVENIVEGEPVDELDYHALTR